MTICRFLSLLLALFLLMSLARAEDLSGPFSFIYKKGLVLTAEEQGRLKKHQFYFVPGILSESFVSDDTRSRLNFSTLTKDYFGEQVDELKKYGFDAKRLSSSSRSVYEIRNNIRKALETARSSQKKAIFVTHSLGGLALLEELVLNPKSQKDIAAIIFLQSPFKGTPIADLYFNYPVLIGFWLKPVLPMFNTTEETLRYLSTSERTKFMNDNAQAIKQLVASVKVLTVGGVANGSPSLFKPAVQLMESGCIKGNFSFCLTGNIYSGPYDKSDGMVPIESSRFEGANYIRLEGVDHGETVVSIPYETFNRADLMLALLKLISPKL